MPRPCAPWGEGGRPRPTRRTATRSSSCWRVRCRPPPKSSTSSSPPCCATRSSSSGPRPTPAVMRLSADELQRFGEALGRDLAGAAVIGLSGELGTGKTTLVQAIGAGLGARVLATSPTYALVHHYETSDGRPVYHVDCYRLRTPDEARALAFDDMAREGAVVLIEWPERAGAWAPPLDRHFRLGYGSDPDTRDPEEIRGGAVLRFWNACGGGGGGGGEQAAGGRPPGRAGAVSAAMYFVFVVSRFRGPPRSDLVWGRD